MKIREAKKEEINEIMPIFDSARAFMQANGNHQQWINGYPQKDFILSEIEAKHCFVCMGENNELVGTFCYIEGDDPTYKHIEGAWLNEAHYATIHRIASNGKTRGVMDHCLEWSKKRIANIRIDTHEINTFMRQKIVDAGFQYCGIIYVGDGSPRFAYQYCANK